MRALSKRDTASPHKHQYQQHEVFYSLPSQQHYSLALDKALVAPEDALDGHIRDSRRRPAFSLTAEAQIY